MVSFSDDISIGKPSYLAEEICPRDPEVDLGGGFSGKKLALLSEVSIHVHAAQKVSDLPLRK